MKEELICGKPLSYWKKEAEKIMNNRNVRDKDKQKFQQFVSDMENHKLNTKYYSNTNNTLNEK